MAFEKSFTTSDGVTHPEAYWMIRNSPNINKLAKTGRIDFIAFHDKAARDANKNPITGAAKYYIVNEALYEEYFAPNALNPDGKNPYEAAYRMALAVQDTNGVSFFDDAQEI